MNPIQLADDDDHSFFFFFIFTFFFYDLIKFFDIVERRRRFAFTASNTLKMRLAQSVAKEALYRLLFLPFAFNLCDFQKKIVIDLLKFCRDIAIFLLIKITYTLHLSRDKENIIQMNIHNNVNMIFCYDKDIR